MNTTTRDFLKEKTHELIKAQPCDEAKAAAEAWLKAVGTPDEASETKRYIAELEEDILPIDDLIAFTESDMAQKVFGEETAKKYNEHGKQIKAAGAKFCDCPACAAVADILSKKSEILG